MNNYKKLSLALMMSLTLFWACDSAEKMETEDGVDYLLVKSGDGENLVEGDYVIFSLKLTNSKDSVLLNSEEIGELPIQVNDSILSIRGPLFSVLKSMKIGDSITTKLSAREVFTQGFGQPTVPEMEETERITVFAKALQKFDTAGFMSWQQEKRAEAIAEMQKEAEVQSVKEDELIQKFLADNSIEAEKTESGLYYEIIEEGTGEKPNAGEMVSVNYTGKLLNGSVFDSSYEEVAREEGTYNERREYGPIEIPIGEGNVIKGWDEGIMLLKEGTKARLYIPSTLAYGPRANGDKIPANSTLIFDVELVEVK